MAKVRTRKLWLHIYFKVPKDVPQKRIIDTLIRSIRRGDYRLPKGWRAVIEWRNKEDATPRRGEWKAELEQSAESSEGFEFAVIKHLEHQR